MLTIAGPGGVYCDGASRRSFLKIGGLGLGGLSLPSILRAESATNLRSSKKAVIMILLPGGPPHLDMFDLKPKAPAEIRGEFKPIATRVPGIEICELMPRLAANMDKFVPIRSLIGGLEDHNLHQCLTGWETHPRQGDSRDIPGYPEGGWPSIGAVVTKLLGPIDPSVPPFLSLAPTKAESTTRASLNQSGYLGAAFAGYEPLKSSQSDTVLRGITLDRMNDRRSLLKSIDQFRAGIDLSRDEMALDGYTSQAFDMLTSSRVSQAMDVSREDPKVRARYGIPGATEAVNGGGKHLESFLIARRLVDAGVRCVTLAFSQWPLERESLGGHNWDWHTGNFKKARITLPMLDMGITALVEDLASTGRLDDVSIVVWGEFGRSPRINGNAGRDHWPRVGGALMAGGGIRAGQVLGATNPMGEYAVERPIHYRDVFATLYHNLGIDAATTMLHDRSNRPHNLIDNRKPIHELV